MHVYFAKGKIGIVDVERREQDKTRKVVTVEARCQQRSEVQRKKQGKYPRGKCGQRKKVLKFHNTMALFLLRSLSYINGCYL